MKKLLDQLQVPYRTNEPLSAHTSFRIGGPARFFAQPENEQQLVALMKGIRSEKSPFFIMGNGSNLLAPDEGFDGIVVSTCTALCGVKAGEDGVVNCQSGALLSFVGNKALENGLSGFEFASGIPGSVGGGVYMNAGAYGGELKDITEEVRYLDGNMELKVLKGSDCEFGYRSSVFKEALKGKSIILSAKFRLRQGDMREIKAVMSELAEKRREKQPLNFPSAGSTFKRPQGYFAAALIDQCGLKGFKVGGAMVSEKHAGFVVNAAGATCRDVLELMERVKERVLREKGVELEPEVELMRPLYI